MDTWVLVAVLVPDFALGYFCGVGITRLYNKLRALRETKKDDFNDFPFD
jgi:hypothetical protein